jgi:hypothetical protein
MKLQTLGAFGTVIVTLQVAACVGQLDVGRVGEDGGSGDGGVGGTPGSSGGSGRGSSSGSNPGASSSGGGASSSGSNPGASSSGGGASSSGGSSSGSSPPAAGLAGFAFIVNGVGQRPLTCPSANWEFPPPPSTTTAGSADAASSESVCAGPHMCPGITSVVIENTGQVSVAYIAQSTWNLPNHYEPGVPTGEADQLVGVLAPGARVDITSVFAGEITALLGSSAPFSSPGKNVSDEGTIPWPAGVAGSGGSQFMSLAEINMYSTCVNGGSLL